MILNFHKINTFLLLFAVIFVPKVLMGQACSGTQAIVTIQNIVYESADIFTFEVAIHNSGTTTTHTFAAYGGGVLGVPVGTTGTLSMVEQPSANGFALNVFGLNFNATAGFGSTPIMRWSNNAIAAPGIPMPLVATKIAKIRFTRTGGTALPSAINLTWQPVPLGFSPQVTSYCNGNGNSAALTLSVGLITTPENDNCTAAITLNGNGPGTPTTTPVPGTTGGATASSQGTGSCGGTANDDVWYKFTTNGVGGEVIITTSGAISPIVEGFASCGVSAPFACGTGGTVTFPGLAAATTYYVRVYDAATNLEGAAEERSAGTFTISASSVGVALPVELISFTARPNGASNLIEWATATERNVQNHIIERSTDGISNWTEIGRIAAKGNTTTESRYSLKDNKPTLKSYYRLRSVDFDTKENVSNIVLVSRKNADVAFTEVFPVPTDDFVNVRFFSNDDKELNIEITDVAGKLVRTIPYSAQAGENAYRLEMGVMASGVYLLSLNYGVSSTEAMRIVKN
jgi:Secretion system C-terminal sorting domain